MNVRITLILTLVFAFQLVFSQTKNATIKDPNLDNEEILIGYCDLKGLTSGFFGIYFDSQYEFYTPSEKYIEKLRPIINNVDIEIVFASWCGDSKIQMGRFFKVIDQAGYNSMHLKIIGVNSEKNGVSVNVSDRNIERVPTFIVYQNGVELGRIVETPKKSLEKDLAKIVGKAQ